jgi:hypothetical protein
MANRLRAPWQFSIARILACTALVALATWAATNGVPFTLGAYPFEEYDLAPFIVVTVLLAAAVGALVGGKPGAAKGARAGCGVLILAVILGSAVLQLRFLFMR